MGIKQELGQKIKIMRKKLNITQEKLAEQIDISPRAMSGIELGEYYPKADTLDKIISVLNTTSEELFANETLGDNDKLIIDINKKIDLIKNDKFKIKILYRLVKALVSE